MQFNRKFLTYSCFIYRRKQYYILSAGTKLLSTKLWKMCAIFFQFSGVVKYSLDFSLFAFVSRSRKYNNKKHVLPFYFYSHLFCRIGGTRKVVNFNINLYFIFFIYFLFVLHKFDKICIEKCVLDVTTSKHLST